MKFNRLQGFNNQQATLLKKAVEQNEDSTAQNEQEIEKLKSQISTTKYKELQPIQAGSVIDFTQFDLTNVNKILIVITPFDITSQLQIESFSIEYNGVTLGFVVSPPQTAQLITLELINDGGFLKYIYADDFYYGLATSKEGIDCVNKTPIDNLFTTLSNVNFYSDNTYKVYAQ